VVRAAERGVAVLGVCNGFQVLTEAGLLPGALMRNAGIRFVCRDVALKVETSQSLFTSGYDAGERIHIPVAHHDGNYYADAETLDRLEGEGRVAFRYAEPVNGSQRDIAGVLNDRGNVLGMMPHPERMIEAAQGGTDGRVLFESVVGGWSPPDGCPAGSGGRATAALLVCGREQRARILGGHRAAEIVPWIFLQPSARITASCSSVSTPSAVVDISRLSAIATTARTIARLSAFLRAAPCTKMRSTLIVENRICRRYPSEE
jgi:hypothetical protein